MSEITPEEAEAIIDAAARGEVADVHTLLGETLADLHAPAIEVVDGAAPILISAGGNGLTARIARRTAIAASAAVLGLAGVAAATTVGFELLDTGGDDGPELIIDEIAPDIDTAAITDSSEGSDDDAVTPESNDAPSVRVESVPGVDPTDGLDGKELEILCDAATNHGDFASAVAKDKVTESDDGPGRRVGEAAKSDCGEGDGPGSERADAAPATDADPRSDGATDEPGTRGRGHDKNGPQSNGNGRETAPGQNK